MGPPGGSRQEITPRFVRHFNVVSINAFSEATMSRIFTSLLSVYMRVGARRTTYSLFKTPE